MRGRVEQDCMGARSARDSIHNVPAIEVVDCKAPSSS